MNDDFISSGPYTIIGHGSDVSKTIITDSSGTTIGDLDIKSDSEFHVPHERSVIIQSHQRVSLMEILHIPEDRREEFLDHVKEKALRGMIEQTDLVNAVSYEEGIDPITHEKIITAKLKVIIDE